ncbi:MAG: hypothetical protein H0X16_10185 [Chloroflexi bacterium]|nr:hypothetical protein [Chloroflexota bacterium]
MNEARPDDWSGGLDREGPVTCAICGCRLTEARELEGSAWRHFQTVPDSDARGCRPSCLGLLHGADGTVLAVRSLESLMEAPAVDPAAA